jgi:hypothetical protein
MSLFTPFRLPHAYRLPPLDDTPTRAEIVERLRLLWQGSVQTAKLLETLDLVIDALGLTAERQEIFGEALDNPNQPGEES